MKPTITLITPTADQPTGIALLEKYMAAQTVPFDQWIVSDDGAEKATLNMNQQHLKWPRTFEQGQSLASNIIRALGHANGTRMGRGGDIILIIEHDDFYASNHIEVQVENLSNALATGCTTQRYYNVQHRCWREMKNVGTSLCNTAFRKALISTMASAAQRAFDRRAIGLDRMFWDVVMRKGFNLSGSPCMRAHSLHSVHTVVGIKGLPGRAGLGIGHRPQLRPGAWTQDRDGTQLREWTGAAAANYLELPQP